MGRPPLKRDEDTNRITVNVPASWLRKLDDWRRREPGLPSMSEAIRRLVELGMEAERKGKRR